MDCTRLRRRSLLLAGVGLRAQGWESLFDGRTTAGWMAVAGGEFPGDSWVVSEGCLKAVVRTPTFQDIRTAREFGDFELEFQWRMAAGGNSGVKYLIGKYDSWTPKGADKPHARARGLEYQLGDEAAGPKGVGAMYDRVAAEGARVRPAGEFNESRIVVQRPLVEHWLNGRKVVSVRLTEAVPARSAISLQNHSSECWFRAIRIHVL